MPENNTLPEFIVMYTFRRQSTHDRKYRKLSGMFQAFSLSLLKKDVLRASCRQAFTKIIIIVPSKGILKCRMNNIYT